MSDFHVLGDVHLGKKFQHGVPLHRRGEREAMQWLQFEQDLEVPCDYHVQMGDLFDATYVSFSVIYQTAMAYRAARRRNPNRVYVILRGNHDASRDADKVSAFQIFTEMVRPFGIVVVDDDPVEIADLCFIPWHPFKTAEEMLPMSLTGMTCFGHWDVVMGGTNQLPAAEMKARGAVKAYTGHDHNARDLTMDGLPVRVTGSMQPYSHAEDPTGQLYVTITLADVGGDFKDKCVRLVLQPGEVLDEPIDCLQFQVQRAGQEDVDMGEVQFETFDLQQLFHAAVLEVGLSEEMAEIAYSKLEEERAR